MPNKLNVGKVALGAFLFPWLNRAAFARALAIPLAMLVVSMLSWHYGDEHLPELSNWVLAGLYSALFAIFAVTCHRLVLLDPGAVASHAAPRWSWRETRFLLWLVAVWLIFSAATFGLTMLLSTVLLSWADEPDKVWFERTVNVAEAAAYYLFARLSLVFPATAIDRKVDLKWSWRFTANNGWRLALLVCVLPWVISQALDLLNRDDASVLETVVLTCLGSILLVVEVAALSLSYHELTKDDTTLNFD